MKYENIRNFSQRCEEHPDHQSGMISHQMLLDRAHEEIDELREYIEQAQKQAPVASGIIRTLVSIDKDGIETWKHEPFYTTPPQRQPLTDAVINAAREALDASFEAGNDEIDISIPAHLAAALSMRLDEYDADHGIKGEA